MRRIRKAVGAIIMNASNEVLLAHKVKIMDGNTAKQISEWDFIKGGMKEGEEIHDALKRELIEEANLTEYISAVELPAFKFDFSAELQKILNFDSQITYFFKVLVSPETSEVKPDFDEIDELRFVSIPNALELMTHETSKTYLNNLIEKGMLI